MSTISFTKLFNFLTTKLGKETMENLDSFIENKINDKANNYSQKFATKVDLANLEARIIKWMFVFWVSQVAATFGFIIFFIKN